MASITVEVTHNEAGRLAAELHAAIDRAVRKQVLRSEANVKTNIVKYNAIDTGNMLNSVQGRSTGSGEGEVSVGAEYGVYVNYGTYKMAARPFFSEEETQAAQDFPKTVAAEIEALG